MDSENELRNSIVPKIEREFPSTLIIDQNTLPAIRNWKAGERYMIKLSVENVEQKFGSLDDPNNKNKFTSKFRVLGAQEVSYDDAGRSVIRPMARMMAEHQAPKKSKLADAFSRFFEALMGE